MSTPIDAYTWNPVSGCTRVSDGCSRCRIWALPTGATPGPPQLHEDKMLRPLGWKKPRFVRVCDTGDLFHSAVPDEWVHRVYAVMALTPQHTYMVCTKRPARAARVLSDPGFAAAVTAAAVDLVEDDKLGWINTLGTVGVPPPLRNVWLGTSVEDQQWADRRVPELLRAPAALRYVVCEPLLDRISLTPWLPPNGAVQWVVIGGERGPGARIASPSWVTGLCGEADRAGVPVWFRGWGQIAFTSQLPRGTARQVRYRAERRGKPVPLLHRDAPIHTGDYIDGRQRHDYPTGA